MQRAQRAQRAKRVQRVQRAQGAQRAQRAQRAKGVQRVQRAQGAQRVQRARRGERTQRVQVDTHLGRVDVDGQHRTRRVSQRLLDDVAAAAAERVDHEEPAPRLAHPHRDVRREPFGRHRIPALRVHPHASVELREELAPL